MRRRKIESFEDMLRAPEGQWFELPEGGDVEVLDETTDPPTRRLYMRLSPRVARDFAPGRGETLTAKISDRTLTLEKVPKRRTRAGHAR